MKFKILAITILLSLISIGCNESEDIKIDKQIWMSKNLNVIKFNNGDLIKEAKTKSEWIDALKSGTPAWCYSDNDINNGERYGVLYNWFVISDKRGITTIGYHIPTKAEWLVLINFLGGEKIAGEKLKSTLGWEEQGNGSDTFGFCGLPGGFRDELGDFNNEGSLAMFWTTTEFQKNNLCYFINLDWGTNDCNFEIGGKGYGFSVRCIKDK